MNRFDGHCIVITGAASGIGEATAREIVKQGGSVLIADLQEQQGQVSTMVPVKYYLMQGSAVMMNKKDAMYARM